MKVLVTGASGFLGRYVIDGLRRRDIETVACGRTRPTGIEESNFFRADLLATENWRELVAAADASHLMHLAWYVEHGKYWASPLNLRWVDATVKLTEAFCQSGGQGVVAAGSCTEYDWGYGNCREHSTPLNPSTLYGVAKDAARRLVMAVCGGKQVPCAWGRVFFPFGAGESKQRLVPSLIDALKGDRPPFGVNATACRDFLHAADVANGMIALLQRAANGEYNISSAQPTRIDEVVQGLAHLLDADAQPILSLTANFPSEPPLLVGDNARLMALGWTPQYALREGLQRTLDDLRASPAGT